MSESANSGFWTRHFSIFRKKRAAQEGATELETQEICFLGSPNAQSMMDLAEHWTSRLPAVLGVNAGHAALFEDGRVEWAVKQLGGLTGKTIVELGPLEAGHTFMLEQAGAQEIVSIEANKASFIKCLIVKELLNLTKSKFLLGNFSLWLDENTRKFDVAWAAGVLYHMDEPARLLRQLSKASKSIYIWTHYVPDEYSENEAWFKTVLRVEDRDFEGMQLAHYVKTYYEMGKDANYCGGVFTTSCWLRRGDILAVLRHVGFTKIETDMDVRDHPNGPCFHLVASKG